MCFLKYFSFVSFRLIQFPYLCYTLVPQLRPFRLIAKPFTTHLLLIDDSLCPTKSYWRSVWLLQYQYRRAHVTRLRGLLTYQTHHMTNVANIVTSHGGFQRETSNVHRSHSRNYCCNHYDNIISLTNHEKVGLHDGRQTDSTGAVLKYQAYHREQITDRGEAPPTSCNMLRAINRSPHQ